MFKIVATLFLAGQALASPAHLEERQSCPGVHVFGARETTVSQGYGSSATVVNLVLGAYSGSTAEAIVYPACGGQSSCGGISYANSESQGVAAVGKAVNAFNAKCPSTKLVLVGYSQGGQIFDDAICAESAGLTSASLTAIKAAIFMGDPKNVAGLSYNVGTCQTQGFAAHPKGYVCPNGSKIKSYCDAADPYCCTGNNAATHQGYGAEYGAQALAFIKSKLG